MQDICSSNQSNQKSTNLEPDLKIHTNLSSTSTAKTTTTNSARVVLKNPYKQTEKSSESVKKMM